MSDPLPESDNKCVGRGTVKILSAGVEAFFSASALLLPAFLRVKNKPWVMSDSVKRQSELKCVNVRASVAF